jgi:enoyl-CoA hydratase/carnithine racemase
MLLTDILRTEDRDRVRLLTFNRPDRANAFNEELYHAAADALRAAASDDDVAVVVFTGAGKAFCAGTDLLEMAETVDAGVSGRTTSRSGFPAFVDQLQEFPKPLLAAVNGAAVGLGFTMLAHCDIVFVSDDARLLAPFTNMGVAPEAASSYLLPRRMGRQRAAVSLFTSEWISADDAVATGLAVQKSSPESLVDDAMELATRIASKSLPSLMATKRLLLDAEREGIVRARTLENQAFAELLALPNAKDGVLGQLD